MTNQLITGVYRQEYLERVAEFSRQFQQNVNKKVIPDIGTIDQQWSPMWVANNQLKYDEEQNGALRYTLSQLRNWTLKEYQHALQIRHAALVAKLAKDLHYV